MKKQFSYIIASLFCLACLLTAFRAEADSQLRIVATLSTFADITTQIGGEHVQVDYISPPTFNPHFIEPRPTHVAKVRRADLFIHGGMDLEIWREPLLNSVGNKDFRSGGSRELNLSHGISVKGVPPVGTTRAEGDIHMAGNPHYWSDPSNGVIIAKNIKDKLCNLQPENCPSFKSNFNQFNSDINSRITKWKDVLSPLQGAEFIGYHDEWIYFADFAGLRVERFIEPKPGIVPSPRSLSELSQYISKNKVKGILQATFYAKDAAKFLQKETGVKFLLMCQGVGELAECSSYQAMIDHNINLLAGLLE